MLDALPFDVVVSIIESSEFAVDVACVFTCTCTSLASIAATWFAKAQYAPNLFFVLPARLSPSSYCPLPFPISQLPSSSSCNAAREARRVRAQLHRRLRLLSSLTSVDIRGRDSVVQVDDHMIEMVQMSNVRTLEIAECDQLTDMRTLFNRTSSSSLTSLTLVECPKLAFDLDISAKWPSLTHLHVSGCSGMNDASPALKLSHLRRLVVHNCFNLTDLSVVVADAANVRNLTHIDASGSSIGSIDPLERCEALTHLNVSRCYKLTDAHVAALRRCPLLTHLDVSRCFDVTDVGIASVVSSCTRLEYLDVSYCMYVRNDSIGVALDKCPHLASLSMRNCKNVSVHHALDWPRRRWCSRAPRADHLWRALTHLDIEACAFEADMCAIANTCPHLRSLSIGNCYNLSERAIVLTLATLPSLARLDMRYCGEVTDASMAALVNCTRLSTMCLASCCHLTDSGVAALASHCPHLEHVEISGCPRVSDVGVVLLAEHCVRLRFVDMGFCSGVSDVGVVALARSCSRLRHVDMRFCTRVTDVGVRAVAHECTSLSYLNASGCPLVQNVGAATTHAASPLQLSYLNLNHCVDVVSVSVLLRRSPAVRFVYLRDCKHVTDFDVHTIAHSCPLLQKLDMFGCSAVTDLAPIVRRCIHLQLMYVPASARFRSVRALVASLGRGVGLYPEYTESDYGREISDYDYGQVHFMSPQSPSVELA
ncbi:MAG: hypothetical protein EB084_23855 [Proteobacteria bacterium]|nr:hypothetical protein [Pseudomonadota bacterium]